MLRALQRSILGRNCGASFCSMMVQEMPRRTRSTASVKPVGPAPIMRTWVSTPRYAFFLKGEQIKGFARKILQKYDFGCAYPKNNLCEHSYGGGGEVGELGAFRHDIADRAFERLEAAVGGSTQGVLHLHGFKHQERRAARDFRAGRGEDAGHRARHGCHDAAAGNTLARIAGERIDPVKREGSARRGQIEVAARADGGARLRNVPEHDLEASALARLKTQRLPDAGMLQAHAVARIPQRRVAMVALATKAQAAQAAAGAGNAG